VSSSCDVNDDHPALTVALPRLGDTYLRKIAKMLSQRQVAEKGFFYSSSIKDMVRSADLSGAPLPHG
jgi:hypothetical protein